MPAGGGAGQAAGGGAERRRMRRLVGPALAALGIERRGDHWLWVGGPVPPGADAITIWSVISVRRASAGSEHLLRHEAEHVRQWRRLGFLPFLRRYLGSYARRRWQGFGHRAAYRLIPLEVEAEAAARAERR